LTSGSGKAAGRTWLFACVVIKRIVENNM